MAKTSLMLDKLLPSAKVVDGTLILTLPDAVRPVVWQMELGQTKSAGMEVRETEGRYALVLKTGRQDIQEIAPYETREHAVRALMTISKALESAQGRLRQTENLSGNNYPLPALIPAHDAGAGKFIRVAVAAVVILGLVFVFTKGTSTTSSPAGVAPAAGANAPITGSETGVPLSADDYLNLPQDEAP